MIKTSRTINNNVEGWILVFKYEYFLPQRMGSRKLIFLLNKYIDFSFVRL